MSNTGGFFTRIVAFFMSLIMAVLGAVTLPGQKKESPKPATEREYCFDNDRLLIGAYCFSKNSESEKLVAYAKEAGLDFIISGGYEEYLDACDEYGLGAIVTNYNKCALGINRNNPEASFELWKNISADKYDFSHECIWGDDMIDEPNASLFPGLGESAEAYYANIPGKLPYINLLPMYATGEQLGNITDINEDLSQIFGNVDCLNTSVDQYKMHIDEYIENIDTDYICTDIYPLSTKNVDGVDTKMTYNGWLRNLDILATACRDTGRDLWVITQAAGLKEDDKPRYCDTPEDIRWQMYVTLAFGAKAIIHACYYGGWWDTESHMIDNEFNRTDTYYAVQTVNKEVAAFADIYGNYINKGAFLTNKLSAAGNLTGHLELVKDFSKPAKVTDDPVLIGCFEAEDGDGTAYSIVNMYEPQLNKEAEITLRFPNADTLTLYRKGVAEVIEGDTLKLTLESCEGVFVTAE